MPSPPTPYGLLNGAMLGGGYGLLSGTSPLFNAGIALLSQPRYSLTPRGPFEAIGQSLTQGVAMSREAQQAAMQNELYRAKLVEAQAEQKQKQALTEFLTSPNFTPPPGMDKTTAGFLALTAPGEFAKAYVTSPADALARAQLVKLTREEKEDFSSKERAVAATFSGAGQFADALTGLEGKVLEPGQPGVKLGRDVAAGVVGVADLVGYAGPGVENLRNQVVDFDTLNKLSAGLVNQLVQNLPGTRVGANTMTLVGQATAGPGISVGANRRILISTLKDAIQASKDLGYKVDIAGAEKLITALENSTVGGATPSEKDVPQIGAARAADAAGPAATGQEYPPFAEPSAVRRVQTVPLPPASPSDVPASASPFNEQSNYVMQGPGLGSAAADLFASTGIPQAYQGVRASVDQAMPYVQNAAAPAIQQATKTAAQAVIKGKDVVSFAGRKLGEIDASGTVAKFLNESDKRWLRGNTEAAKTYLRRLYEAGVREIR